ncbi:hypothetical protein K9M47_02115 [Candidatus Gracilibacteria bacterium]|nr:hypothetical protein [Candidatus Gracilibacteria bacterium]MCF7898744.1 hypothetical protein [Candidatus Paceibacterota bacterium]
MGSYCYLKLGDFSLISSKSQVEPESMLIFREADKKVYEIDNGPDEPPERVYEYSNTANNIKERLNVMGHTMTKVEESFGLLRILELKRLKEYIDEDAFGMAEKYEFQKKILEESTFQEFVEACKIIRINDFTYFCLREDGICKRKHKHEFSEILKYILELSQDDGRFLGFLNLDLYDEFLIFLHTCPDNEIVKMDISDLVNGGWYDHDDEVCNYSINLLKRSHYMSEKIILLTEGSSDRHILESTLHLLFPHLSDYYSFMNFETSNASGGASSLVSTIKSFTGSGITNRIIAIFDNDTAGKNAIKTLEKTVIPQNIKVMQYPDIELAEKYPTIGPSGNELLNVNGRAAGIEIYLGKESLLDSNNELIPVQWKGYDTTLKQYQGEIIDKAGAEKRFFEKIKECRADPKIILSKDWKDLESIFNVIFKAFQ